MKKLLLLVSTILGIVVTTIFFVIQERQDQCAYIPFMSPGILPNAALNFQRDKKIPNGWEGKTQGVELRGQAVDPHNKDLWGFDLDGDGRSIQLIGIANEVRTPYINIQPETTYCFKGQALTDSEQSSSTRARIVFYWFDRQNHLIDQSITDWQPITLWQIDNQPSNWSIIHGSFTAPQQAKQLRIAIQPSSDDRIYLDAMQVRPIIIYTAKDIDRNEKPNSFVRSWPYGAEGALSISFDWETAMGGLTHSRSVDDLYSNRDPLLRAMRMREGVTTTLRLLEPHDISATYYANGYNFLLGNVEQHQFMGNPTFTWATTEEPYNWQTDQWIQNPWFSHDPYGTVSTHPEWYFGDLIPILQHAKQDIQSHTFSHLYGGFANDTEWRADLLEWQKVAEEQHVNSARSLAFPWSSSAGMSDANWQELELSGITSVTRTSWSVSQSILVDRTNPHCRSIPGHENILACPDFYLKDGHNDGNYYKMSQMYAGGDKDFAKKQIDTVIQKGGMIDIWSHTEEVITPSEITAWSEVIQYAVQKRDQGQLWIAPLADIADWQRAIQKVHTYQVTSKTHNSDELFNVVVENTSNHKLEGVTLALPFTVSQIWINDHPQYTAPHTNSIFVDLEPQEIKYISAK